jgi:Tol biopolymer transport system component
LVSRRQTQLTRFGPCQIRDLSANWTLGKVTFVRQEGFGDNIYVANLDGSGFQKVLEGNLGYHAHPVLGNDGRTVWFISNADYVGENPERNVRIFGLDLENMSVYQFAPPLLGVSGCLGNYSDCKLFPSPNGESLIFNSGSAIVRARRR